MNCDLCFRGMFFFFTPSIYHECDVRGNGARSRFDMPALLLITVPLHACAQHARRCDDFCDITLRASTACYDREKRRYPSRDGTSGMIREEAARQWRQWRHRDVLGHPAVGHRRWAAAPLQEFCNDIRPQDCFAALATKLLPGPSEWRLPSFS